MRLLDLFCGAGGAAMGYHQAGFTEIVGVDIQPQPRYPFIFVQADALNYVREHGQEFDVIHASPPCQAHTALKTMWNARIHDDLIPGTRDILASIGRPFVIENVPGAPLNVTLLLCGSMFDLGCKGAVLRRHRLFESNKLLWGPGDCYHQASPVIGLYGGHRRDRRRTIIVTGHSPTNSTQHRRMKTISIMGGSARDRRTETTQKLTTLFSVDQAKEAMGIDWMTMAELSQAIPPAYTAWIGHQLLHHMGG